jgi:hypothetical protein
VSEPAKKEIQVHQCRACSSQLVQPVEWTRVDEQQWVVEVRCPECDTNYELALDQEQINDFSYSLECAFQSLLDAIEEIDREVFVTECEQFIAALWSDNVQPMDF